jgi:multidrug efflux pump subunit AcrA (membrane-fusion protein)
MTRPPFAVLKLSLILLLVALLLAGIGAMWSREKAHNAKAALLQQQAALDAAQLQLDRSREQQQLIDTHLADYQALARRGFVGAEDRLAWIEAVQLANREAGLAGLEYRLNPRTASDPKMAQGLALGQTAMFLTLPLLVETDLPRFLAALNARATGIYRVQGCRLSRLGDAAFEAINQPRLQAECELLWFTVAQTQGGPS